jgi:hypothetical protein
LIVAMAMGAPLRECVRTEPKARRIPACIAFPDGTHDDSGLDDLGYWILDILRWSGSTAPSDEARSPP